MIHTNSNTVTNTIIHTSFFKFNRVIDSQTDHYTLTVYIHASRKTNQHMYPFCFLTWECVQDGISTLDSNRHPFLDWLPCTLRQETKQLLHIAEVDQARCLVQLRRRKHHSFRIVVLNHVKRACPLVKKEQHL